MTIIHTGNTTTTGFTVTSDTNGELVIKTGGAGGTTALTVGADQRVTFAQPPLTAVPVFSVSLSSDQTGVAGSTDVKVNFDTVDYNEGSYWDTTNKWYKPLIPGYYQFNGVIRCIVSGGLSILMRVTLYKNGTEVAASYVQTNTNSFNNSHPSLSYMVYCDGVNDYIELYGYIATGSTTSRSFGTFAATVGGSNFQGFLVRAT